MIYVLKYQHSQNFNKVVKTRFVRAGINAKVLVERKLRGFLKSPRKYIKSNELISFTYRTDVPVQPAILQSIFIFNCVDYRQNWKAFFCYIFESGRKETHYSCRQVSFFSRQLNCEMLRLLQEAILAEIKNCKSYTSIQQYLNRNINMIHCPTAYFIVVIMLYRFRHVWAQFLRTPL